MLQKTDSNLYRLSAEYKRWLPLFNQPDYSPQNRMTGILSILLSSEDGADIFDLADDFFVSTSAVESDLNKIRKLILGFDITLNRQGNLVLLKGSEKNKRKLISSIIMNDKYDGFDISDSQYLMGDYQIKDLISQLKRIFHECHLTYNDYSINNIMLHLIIIIDRLKSRQELAPADDLATPLSTDLERQAADQIISYIEDEYDLAFPLIERQNLILFLSCNLVAVDYTLVNSDNMMKNVSSDAQILVGKILKQIEDYYYLGEFDDIFLSRFTFHIHNLLKRIHGKCTVHNPLKYDIKTSYPFIFDVAVFISNIIFEETGYLINEDEISLIGLHIGGFMETRQKEKGLSGNR